MELICTDEVLESLDLVNIKLVETGLDQLPLTGRFSLIKKSAKNEKKFTFVEPGFYIKNAELSLIIQQDDIYLFNPKKFYLALYLTAFGDYFRSSRIVKCRKEGSNYEIETENSYYLLTEDKKCTK